MSDADKDCADMRRFQKRYLEANAKAGWLFVFGLVGGFACGLLLVRHPAKSFAGVMILIVCSWWLSFRWFPRAEASVPPAAVPQDEKEKK